MLKQKPGIDIVNDLLEDCILAYPLSSFVISIYKQYQQRGSLSKKQLQGLHGKAMKIEGISVGKLGTLEAIIKKMPTRYKSDLPQVEAEPERDESHLPIMQQILDKYPQHKRVLFLKAKHENREQLTETEISELKKFAKLLLDKK